MNRDLLNVLINLSNFGADGKQHTRLINQFDAREIIEYIYAKDKEIDRLNNRINKAIEYIEKNKHLSMFADCREPEEDWSYDLECSANDLLNILQDKEEV